MRFKIVIHGIFELINGYAYTWMSNSLTDKLVNDIILVNEIQYPINQVSQIVKFKVYK